jgi:hypothetical protein
MVLIGHVRVRMPLRLMAMRVIVWADGRHGVRAGVMAVLMAVGVLVFLRIVRMFVRMPLGQQSDQAAPQGRQSGLRCGVHGRVFDEVGGGDSLAGTLGLTKPCHPSHANSSSVFSSTSRRACDRCRPWPT